MRICLLFSVKVRVGLMAHVKVRVGLMAHVKVRVGLKTMLTSIREMVCACSCDACAFLRLFVCVFV